MPFTAASDGDRIRAKTIRWQLSKLASVNFRWIDEAVDQFVNQFPISRVRKRLAGAWLAPVLRDSSSDRSLAHSRWLPKTMKRRRPVWAPGLLRGAVRSGLQRRRRIYACWLASMRSSAREPYGESRSAISSSSLRFPGYSQLVSLLRYSADPERYSRRLLGKKHHHVGF